MLGTARLVCPFLLAALLARAQVNPPHATPAENTPQSSSYTSQQLQELPLSPGFWGVLQNLEPAAVTEPLDFGGLASGFLPLLSFEAGSWTGVGYLMNGLDTGDPYQTGRTMFLPNHQSIETVKVRLSPWAPSPPSLVPSVKVSPRNAGQSWHGAVSSSFTGSALASSNLTESASQAGLLRAETFRWYTRNHVQLGGPIGKRAELLVSGTGQWASQSLPRDPIHSSLNTRHLLGTVTGGVRLGKRDRIRAGLNGSRLDRYGYGFPVGFEPLIGRRGAPPFRLHRDLREEDHLDSGRASWIREPGSGGPSRSFELRYGHGSAHLNTYPAPISDPLSPSAQARIELTDGAMRGPAVLANRGVRTRHQIEVVWHGNEFTLASSRHHLTSGVCWQRSSARNRLTAPTDTHFIFAQGRPVSVVQLNTPLDSRGRTTSLRFHVSDSAILTSWFSIEAALLTEHVRGSLPPQSSPRGAHFPARRFPEQRTLVTWSTIAPRFAMVVSPPWSFAPELRASYGRHHFPLGVRYLDFANPNSLSGDEYRWLDFNADLFWQAGETGVLLRRFGGAHSAIDPSLRRPYVEEFAVDAGISLPLSLRANLRLFRRDLRQRMAAVNVGVPFQLPGGEPSYRPEQVLDPGPDFVVGTHDDQVLTVYNQHPNTFGEDFFLLTNTDLRSFSAGLVAQLAARTNRYWWRLTFAAEKGYGTTSFGNDPWENDPGVVGSLLQDPNGLLNATGRTFFDRAYVAKFHGAFKLPPQIGGVELGVIASYWDGLPFGRKLLVEGLSQGPILVLATPRGSPEGGHRTEFNLTLDLRLSRRFELPRGELRILADVFNLLNLDNNIREHDLSGPAFSNRLPVAIQPPRFVRLGLDYNF